MDHVRPQLPDGPAHPRQTRKVERVRIAVHGDARRAERQMRGQFRQERLGAGASRPGVAQDADLVAALALAAGKIEHMAEEAARRRSEDMEDAQRRRGGAHARDGRDRARTPGQGGVDVQNQRSLTTIVSPAFIG